MEVQQVQQQLQEEVTREQAIAAAQSYQNVSQKLDGLHSKVRHQQANIAAKYQEDIEVLQETLLLSEEILKRYSEQNEKIFGGKRSTTFAGVKIGYSKGPRKLSTKGNKTWENVLEKIKSIPEYALKYVKRTEGVDKTELKKADDEVLKKVGVIIEQEDKFFVKL